MPISNPITIVSIGNTNILGGTQGSVLFIGTGGVIQQDNSNFFWDDANNRLVLATLIAPSGSNFSISTPNAASPSSITITSGSSTGSGDGGDINMTSGNAGGAATGGDFSLAAGVGGSTGQGGSFSLGAGNGGTAGGAGGVASLLGGNAQAGNSNGGNVRMVAGNKSGSGTSGLLDLETEGGKLRLNGSVFSPQTTSTVSLGDDSLMFSNLTWGTYTPTRSAETNLDSNVTMTEAQYMRVGKTVTVSGRFTADPTLTATTTSFEITLPVSSNLGAAEDLAGVAFCGNIASMGAEVIGVVANDTAKVQWKSSDITSQTWAYTFSYQII